MRLLSIKLQNFQVHKELLIEFGKITTIKGPTDSGKSAILRALRWICLNDIAGDAFITEGEKETGVALMVRYEKQERYIIRSKNTRSLNVYALDEAENLFKAFGSNNLPKEIAEILKLSPINFQDQHDSPFWFAESAPEVSRQLNSIVDLSVIDTTLSNIAAAVRKAQERKEVTEERLEDAQAELERLKARQDQVAEFKTLKAAHEKLEQFNEDCNKLEGIVQSVDTNRAQAKALEEIATGGDIVIAAMREALDCYRQARDLRRLIVGITTLQDKATPPPDFSLVEESFTAWWDLEIRAEELRRLLKRTDDTADYVQSLDKALDAKEKQFHQQTKGKRCPVCGQSL